MYTLYVYLNVLVLNWGGDNLIFVGYSTVKFIQGRLGIGKHNFIYFKDKNIPHYQFI